REDEGSDRTDPGLAPESWPFLVVSRVGPGQAPHRSGREQGSLNRFLLEDGLTQFRDPAIDSRTDDPLPGCRFAWDEARRPNPIRSSSRKKGGSVRAQRVRASLAGTFGRLRLIDPRIESRSLGIGGTDRRVARGLAGQASGGPDGSL